MNKYERTHEELKKQLELLGVYDNEQAAEHKEIISSEVSDMLSIEENDHVEKKEIA
jgi:hypothetical protein